MTPLIRRRAAGAAAAIVLSALLLAGCSKAPPPPPVIDMAVNGSAGQNPGLSGEAQPVAVHVYELAGTQKFERADVYALLEHEQATLGPDLLASSDLVLRPSEQRQIKKEVKAGTHSIGVVALFQKIDQSQWRAVAPIADKGTTRLTLDVGSLSVTLKPSGK